MSSLDHRAPARMLKVFVAVVTFVVAAVVPVVFHEHKYPVRDGSPVRELRTGDSVSISAGALTSVSRVAPLRVDALPAPVLSGGMPLGTRPLDALGKSLAGTARIFDRGHLTRKQQLTQKELVFQSFIRVQFSRNFTGTKRTSL